LTYNPQKHHRRSIRLKGYNYSQAGLYFITLCTQNRSFLFGKIKNREMILNDAGRMVENEWLKLPERFKNIALHEYIVMPNHFHAILEIVGATLVVAPNDVAPNDDVAPNNWVFKTKLNSTGRNGQPQGIAPTNTPTNTPTSISTNTPIYISTNTPTLSATDKRVGDMVGAFESITTVEYIRGVKNNNWPPFDKKIWQRNYYEHIIRTEQSYLNISKYIENNPANWSDDSLK